MSEFDRTENNRVAGTIGGKATTPEKQAASRANLAAARARKDFYRRHPDQHPNRQPQQASNGSAEQQPGEQ